MIVVTAALPESTAMMISEPVAGRERREYLALDQAGRIRWLIEHRRVVVAKNVGK